MESTFGSRLRSLRKSQGRRQQDVAKAVGVALSSYALYENDRRRPRPEIMDKICEYLHCDANYLLGYSELGETGDRLAGMRTVMLFKMDDLADGNVTVNKSNLSFALPEDMLPSSKFYFAVQAEDESMLGCSLKRGDYAVFSLTTTPEDGEIFLVVVNGKVLIRFCDLDGKRKIDKLIPANDVYKPFKPQARDEVSVLGKLVAVISAKN